jgi:hypothetical protein
MKYVRREGSPRTPHPTPRGKILRYCPTCGAPPHAKCVRYVTGFYSGQKDGDDGGYTVVLKNFHKER